ncbi:hypothetical protein APS56_10035 [Pseudalgibacter alginicilyticus]|uniref:DUF3157 domain-containing protein n=1 Tax=Pseudalgibacter alginicilyticus TaxID=1736674 RepID=A0A0P0CXW7_9FLAO|nr:DUF3157 family protein [Pseudalgibacter alginicilyticus]ALJ05436.1 hypothetical protein APS56_10035 [Pseudalgibacter alginicilyticus]
MKICILVFICLISIIGFSQNNYIVKTDDGRRVLLKADYTWEYIDVETSKSNTIAKEISIPEENDSCILSDDFVEPQLNKKIQAQLKKGRATIDHVKAKVAKEYNCSVEDVLLTSVLEQKSKATYYFCVKGKEVAYKRVGNSIIEKKKLF